MDSFLFFEIQLNGSMALSATGILALESRLSAAHIANKRVSIGLICGENRSIQLQLQVHPTMSWDSLLISSRRETCSSLPGLFGSPGEASGVGDTGMRSTSEFGKAE